VNSLGPNNLPRIRYTLLKSPVTSLRRYKQEDSRSKIAEAGFHSIANPRALFPRIALGVTTVYQMLLSHGGKVASSF
jgi:hypothetical protein